MAYCWSLIKSSKSTANKGFFANNLFQLVMTYYFLFSLPESIIRAKLRVRIIKILGLGNELLQCEFTNFSNYPYRHYAVTQQATINLFFSGKTPLRLRRKQRAVQSKDLSCCYHRLGEKQVCRYRRSSLMQGHSILLFQ